MKRDDWTAFLVMVVMLGIMWCAGFLCGSSHVRYQALNAGAAEYRLVEPMDGSVEFLWRTNR